MELKVVFIAGLGRSGTTLLARLLGCVPGFVNVGEAARYLWNERMWARLPTCGCGAPVLKCPFWAEIAASIHEEERSKATRALRLRHVPGMLLGWRRPDPALTHSVTRVLARIAGRAGAEVIVDSSKHPANALLLAGVPGVELHVVHLIRDPRAVLASWSRPKGYLRRHSGPRVMALWLALNPIAELLRPAAASYSRLRYEALVASPEGTLRALLQRVGRPGEALPFLASGKARLARDHALAGNPEMLDEGEVEIRPATWTMPPVPAALASMAALPLLLRYGYRVWARSG